MGIAPRWVVCALVLGGVATPVLGQMAGGGQSAGDALPGLSRQLAQARAEFDQAARDYQDATAELARQRKAADEKFESSPQYVNASRGVGDSAAAYNARRREVVADLEKNDERYRELDAQRRAIDMAIDNTRSGSGPWRSRDVLAQLVGKKAEIAGEMKSIEDRELNKAGAGSLREKWVGNARELSDLKSRHRNEAENSAELKPIQDRIRNSRAALDRASANLAAASAAYNESYAQYADQQAQQEYYHRHYAPPFTWYPPYGDGYYYPPGMGYWR